MHGECETFKWQFSIVLNPDRRVLEGPPEARIINMSRAYASTADLVLTKAEVAEVIDAYWETLEVIDAAGHQLDEGIRFGKYASERVADAIAALVRITPSLDQNFGLAIGRGSED